ncbi:hypothetical protein F5B20DRAFT_158559 [Whalleya microplaca]|nr:hypothetical protein F5B20DRAFT_158559 [Whalleya microplaca]
MRAAYRRLFRSATADERYVIAFFFDTQAKDRLSRCLEGMYRSIIYLFLLRSHHASEIATEIFEEKAREKYRTSEFSWSEAELQGMLRELLEQASLPHVVLIVDALDECEGQNVRTLIEFFNDLARTDRTVEAKLDICLSSRHYGASAIPVCSMIDVETENRNDIKYYLNKKFDIYSRNSPEEFDTLKRNIEEKSSGIFLWVVLVVGLLLGDLAEGKRNARYLETRLSTVSLSLRGTIL